MIDAAFEVDVRLALDRFDLEIAFATTQPVIGIFGPSGAGKSSLLEIVAGLRRGARGRVRLGEAVWLDSGSDLFVPPERRRLGYVPQDGLLFPHLDVRRNLLAGSRRGGPGALRPGDPGPAETFERTVEMLQLRPLLTRSVSALSGGERQRVALGRALCARPRLLLLDEPLAALEVPLRRRLLPLLRRLCAELTVPMLLVSHDPIEVQALCDEIVVLRDGRAVARGAPSQVLSDPAIYPRSEGDEFDNVLLGRPISRPDGTTAVRIGSGDDTVDLEVGHRQGLADDVIVAVPAHEIIIATEPPHGLSARNALPAEVTRIETASHLGLVTATLGHGLPQLVVEVTRSTPGQLGLDLGSRIYLVIKATACRVYGLETRVEPTL
jgi:molybdate transport system ATP-binding protein